MLRSLKTPGALGFAVLVAVACGSSGSKGGFAGIDGGGDDAGELGDGTSSSSGGEGSASSSSGSSSSGGKGGSSSGGSSGGGSSGGDAGCYPNGITCQGGNEITCQNGKSTSKKCGSGLVCAPGYGCLECVPGAGMCSGNVGTECNATGTGFITNDCDPLQGESCDPATGTCLGECASLGASYIGCEYYSATMANSLLDQSTFVFSVSIANTGSATATINIQGGALSTPTTATLAPGAIQAFVLPWVTALSTSTTTTIAAASAYHIRSTQPVTVYQFNAQDYVIGGTYSYTNDASLLIPVNALTGNYRVVGAPTWSSLGSQQIAGTIAIVGTTNGTSVTVTPPSSAFQAGAGLAANGGTVTLNAGDVLQIGTALDAPGAGTFGTDPSGTLIKASQPVEVFGGSDCSYQPASTQACDHLEQINFPLETLGKDYLVTVPHNDEGTSRQYVKIVGTAAGTTLTYDGITGQPSTIGAGNVLFFETTTDFRVTATQPIAVGQYMEGCLAFTATGDQTCGDPSMSVAVATPQFRTVYPFTSPPNYYQNWVNVIAANGTTVTVTDTPSAHTVSSGTPIGASGYYSAVVSLCANNATGCTGSHMATASSAFGIQVYGYGTATSYMYPGGLNLTRN